jgi:hypothetical protein
MPRRTRRRVKLLVGLAVIGLLVAVSLVLLLHVQFPQWTNAPGNASAKYITDSPPTSQWLIIRANATVISVSANNTGTIQSYYSLASLNRTSIGYICGSVNSIGGCTSWQYLQQTGWFWDSVNGLLYVHYLGGQNVMITVTESKHT